MYMYSIHCTCTVYIVHVQYTVNVHVNKNSPYSNSNYLSSTISIVQSYGCGVQLTNTPITVRPLLTTVV